MANTTKEKKRKTSKVKIKIDARRPDAVKWSVKIDGELIDKGQRSDVWGAMDATCACLESEQSKRASTGSAGDES